MLDAQRQIRFWDRKIQNWEIKRYRSANSVISSRARFARDILEQRAGGARVLDLGCGSGQLFAQLKPETFASLTGVDFSARAISLAQRKPWASNVTFAQGDACALDLRNYDFIVGLGLLDWLDDAQIERLACRLGNKQFLFSYSEAGARGARWLHSAYVHITYGWRNNGYRPRYFRPQDLRRRFYAEETGRKLDFLHLPDRPLVGFMLRL